MTERYLEDLRVGDKFRSSEFTVSATEIIEFARAYDPQPFHLDSNKATDTIFNGLAASGWHTAAISMRLLVVGELRLVGGTVGLGVEELRWPMAVRPSDTLTLETEILAIRPSKSKHAHGIVGVRNVTKNQKGEVVQTMIATLLVTRRSY